jgi:hypothetical protein
MPAIGKKYGLLEIKKCHDVASVGQTARDATRTHPPHARLTSTIEKNITRAQGAIGTPFAM